MNQRKTSWLIIHITKEKVGKVAQNSRYGRSRYVVIYFILLLRWRALSTFLWRYWMKANYLLSCANPWKLQDLLENLVFLLYASRIWGFMAFMLMKVMDFYEIVVDFVLHTKCLMKYLYESFSSSFYYFW